MLIFTILDTLHNLRLLEYLNWTKHISKNLTVIKLGL